jgi:hypothetical protein
MKGIDVTGDEKSDLHGSFLKNGGFASSYDWGPSTPQIVAVGIVDAAKRKNVDADFGKSRTAPGT